MKRFVFQLEPVLNYKQQALDALMVELNVAQARVAQQERVLDEAFARQAEFEAEYSLKKQQGLSIVEAMECQACQQVLERRVRQESDKLALLQREAEKKRQAVVDARLETHSLERLKEVRQSEYDKDVAKAEEKNLDDLTAARRAAAAS